MTKNLLGLVAILPLLGACQTSSGQVDVTPVVQLLPTQFQSMVTKACGIVIPLAVAQRLLGTIDSRFETISQFLASLCQTIRSQSLARSASGTRTVTFRGVTFQARAG